MNESRDNTNGGRRRERMRREGAGQRGTCRRANGAGKSLGERTAARALVALGTYVAQDLRDAEGLTRPLLRRAALGLALSSRHGARQLGGAYLRLDPPNPAEVDRHLVVDVTAAAPPALPSVPEGEPGHVEPYDHGH